MKNFTLCLLAFLFLQNAQADIVSIAYIATSNSSQAGIQSVLIGSKVLTRAGPQTVVINATRQAPANPIPIAMITYGKSGYFMISPNHPVLTSRGTFKKASSLIPGQDYLVNASGEAVQLTGMKVNLSPAPLTIFAAASASYTAAPETHTILANGIWIGDYAIENICFTFNVPKPFCEK